MTGISAGSVTVQAAYGGNSNNMVSSGTAQITIKAKTSLSVSCTPSSVAVGSSASCTSTLTGYVGSVEGETITWSLAGGNSSATFTAATCTLSSGGTCSVALTGASKGGVGIRAHYAGDADNAKSSGSVRVKMT